MGYGTLVSGDPLGIKRISRKTRVYYRLESSNGMVMECNIDARGKAIRLFGGMASIVAGFGVASVAYFGLVEFPYLWYASAGLLAGGTLGVFEGWSGWCVARAMGIWTPI